VKVILIALGRLVDGALEPRGEGFDPSAAGVVRAGALGHAFPQHAHTGWRGKKVGIKL
jgi:hypothetical protein